MCELCTSRCTDDHQLERMMSLNTQEYYSSPTRAPSERGRDKKTGRQDRGCGEKYGGRERLFPARLCKSPGNGLVRYVHTRIYIQVPLNIWGIIVCEQHTLHARDDDNDHAVSVISCCTHTDTHRHMHTKVIAGSSQERRYVQYLPTVPRW